MKRRQLRRRSTGGTRPKHTFSGVSTLSRDAVYPPRVADAEEPLEGEKNPEVVPQAEPGTRNAVEERGVRLFLHLIKLAT